MKLSWPIIAKITTRTHLEVGLEVEEAHHLDQDQFPDQFHDRGHGPLTIPEDLKIVIEIKIDLIIEMSMVFVIADTSSQANKAKVEVAEASTHSIMEVQVILNFASKSQFRKKIVK